MRSILFALVFVILGCSAHSETLQQIRKAGYDAAMDGIPPEACPCQAMQAKEQWKLGWMEGFRHKKGPK